MDDGEEEVGDRHEAATLRATAARIHRRALAVAAAITLVVLLFPDFQSSIR